MTPIPDEVRVRVRQRAGAYPVGGTAWHRCEYCLSQQAYVMGRLQIDHIQPIAKGGNDSEDNLCLACELCNQYKWTQTEGRDPKTGEMLSLFNPRQQPWTEHFAWSEDGTEIVGQTACGRATVDALRFNNGLAVIVRRNWVRAGWHPPITNM